jgi:AraC-like DNA-binding protein
MPPRGAPGLEDSCSLSLDPPPQCEHVLQRTVLLDDCGLRVVDVQCASHQTGWSDPEPCEGRGVVFVRRGCFRRRVNGREALLDPAVVYFESPGDEQEVAHPRHGGDACTVFALSAETAADLWGGDAELPSEPLFSDAALDLQHRRLVAGARSTDAFELAEGAVVLLAGILERAHPARAASGRPSTAAVRRRGVEDARELLSSNHRLGLFDLARAVAISPHHLSRIFTELTGSSISRYRNRIRVRVALERLADGERSLARLAAELGFADQAHMTRVVRDEVGEVPSHLRTALSA